MKPFPWLNMKAKPHAKKRRPQRQVSTMHSIRTLTVSRERQKPASSMVNPTCIPNTRNAATSVHIVLMGLTMSLPFSVGCSAVEDVLRLDIQTPIRGLGRKAKEELLTKLDDAG